MRNIIKKVLSPIGKLFKGLANGFKAFQAGGTTFVERMKTLVTKGKDLFKTIGKNIKTFGRLLGRLVRFVAAPIALIMGVLAGLKGALDGFTETEGSIGDKILGAMSGFIKGITGFLIGGLLDGLKFLIGKLAGLLGFEGIEEKLASFSFTDLLNKGIDSVFGFINSMIDGFMDGLRAIGNFFGALKAGISAGVGALGFGGESPKEAFLRAFKDTLSSGSVPSGVEGSGSDSGNTIDSGSAENDTEKRNANNGGGSPIIINQKQGDVNTTNSNTTNQSSRRQRGWQRSGALSSSPA